MGKRASLRAGLPEFLPDVGKRAHRPGLAGSLRLEAFRRNSFAPVPLSTFLVEDNAYIRHNLIAAMEDEIDIDLVGTATTEEDAVAWLAENPGAWDLLVVDLFLHEGSGLGIVKRCGRSRPGQCVVVLTNYATGEIADWARQLGADAVFDKAVELDGFFSLCASLKEKGRERGGEPLEGLLS